MNLTITGTDPPGPSKISERGCQSRGGELTSKPGVCPDRGLLRIT